MLDVGWSEMLVIAIVMIVVVGPKDLPQMLRTFGRMMAKMRGMANDFQKQFNEALKEAELEDVKKSVDALRGLNPTAEIRKQLNPFEKAAADVRAGLDNAMKPKPAETPTSTEAPAPAVAEVQPAEPVKNGVDVPGGPDAMPAPPTFPPMTDASTTAPMPSSGEAAKQAPKVTKPATAKAAIAKPSPAKTSPTKTPAKSSSPAAAKAASSSKSAGTKTAKPAANNVAAIKTPAKVAAKPAKPATKPARAPK